MRIERSEGDEERFIVPFAKLCDCRIRVHRVVHLLFGQVNRSPVLFSSPDRRQRRAGRSRIPFMAELHVPMFFLIPAVSDLPVTGCRLTSLLKGPRHGQSIAQWLAGADSWRVVVVA